MHRNQSVNVHNFAMSPRADIPRSKFLRQWTHKTTFPSGYLIPIVVDEVLPGDSFKIDPTIFARLATPLVPTMDNLHLDTFFFFCPNRLLWEHWEEFIGGGPADPETWTGTPTVYEIPQISSASGGFGSGELADYFGLPTAGQTTPVTGVVTVNALPFRMYNKVWNDWFRDGNLQSELTVDTDDGPDDIADYVLKRRNKRHDYFTSCLPMPQRSTSPVYLPLGESAPIRNSLTGDTLWYQGVGPSRNSQGFLQASTTSDPTNVVYNTNSGTTPLASTSVRLAENTDGSLIQYDVDLSEATAGTINAIREAFQVQRLLERDARGGGRYIEQLFSHFGVRPPDFRLQRPEYIGGGSQLIQINPIAQTAISSDTATPQGNLAAMGSVLHRPRGIHYSATEHGYVMGLMMVRADITYQQGVRKMWSRNTRYDFYFPVFAHLGEQAVLRKELYSVGDDGTLDDVVFGYQERWAEYRYFPSQITSKLRSTDANAIDQWHYAQEFSSVPSLNSAFIAETPPLSRTLAVVDPNYGDELIADIFFEQVITRPMPMYSVPGLIDHF